MRKRGEKKRAPRRPEAFRQKAAYEPRYLEIHQWQFWAVVSIDCLIVVHPVNKHTGTRNVVRIIKNKDKKTRCFSKRKPINRVIDQIVCASFLH